MRLIGRKIKWYLTYVLHPGKIIELEDEADQAVDLAHLHLGLREQAEEALRQERARNGTYYEVG